MKINRHGQAKILTQPELALLFSQGLTLPRDRALFGTCLYTACRINEACTLHTADIFNPTGQIRSHLVIRKENTKGKLDTRTMPILEDLRQLLLAYRDLAGEPYLFPGRRGSGHIHPDSATAILITACRQVGLEGVSSHSFRRTALTQMSNSGIPLRVIQKISGHRSLSQLQEYLEVRPDQVTGAITSLSMLGVSEIPHVGKQRFPDASGKSGLESRIST